MKIIIFFILLPISILAQRLPDEWVSLEDESNYVTMLSATISLHPDNPTAYVFRSIEYANSRSMENNKELALNDLNKAIDIFENNITYNLKKYFSNTLVISIPNSSITIRLDFMAYSLRSKLYKSLKDYDSAISDLSKVIAIAEEEEYFYLPKATGFYGDRASLFRKLGNYDQAISDYQTDREYDDEFGHEEHKLINTAFTLKNIAETYYEKGDLNKALATYNNAVEAYRKASNADSYDYSLKNQYARILGQRGILKLEIGNKNGACYDFDRAIELENNCVIWFPEKIDISEKVSKYCNEF